MVTYSVPIFPQCLQRVVEFLFLGINMFFALSLSHFNPCLAAQAKMTLSCIQNLFMPVNINSIILLITLFLHMQLILQ